MSSRFNDFSLLSLSTKVVARKIHLYRGMIKGLPAELKTLILLLMMNRVECAVPVLLELINQKVTKLRLHDTLFCDEVIDAITICSSVTNLEMFPSKHGSSITSKALEKLFPSLPLLSILSITECPALTDSVVETVVNSCPFVRTLCLRSCYNLTDISAKHISRLRNLLHLDIACTNISDSGMHAITHGESSKEIEEMKLNNSRVSDKGIEDILSNCPQLKIIICHDCPLALGTSGFEDKLVRKMQHVTYTVY